MIRHSLIRPYLQLLKEIAECSEDSRTVLLQKELRDISREFTPEEWSYLQGIFDKGYLMAGQKSNNL